MKNPPRTFAAGEPVRVKPGITDPDYPNFPIGGWVGRIAEVEAGELASCLVRWSQQNVRRHASRLPQSVPAGWLGHYGDVARRERS